MSSYIIKNATIYTPDGVTFGAIGIQNGRIVPHTAAINATIIDAQGAHLVPGFIDLQLNGGFGDDFTTDPTTMWPVAQRLPRYGVTSFLPTIITSPAETVAEAQQVLLRGAPRGWSGARPLGLHIEGPFFNPAKKGAHPAELLRTPSPAAVADWTPDNGISLVTMAPELPYALETIYTLCEQGVLVSAGHSMATYEEAQQAFRAGVYYGTHLFNAMPTFNHREPGLVGALLDSDTVTGIIADGIHVHPAAVKMAWQAKRGTLNLVTDAMAALGCTPGRYQIGQQEVFVTETDARLADGTLAGSILSLDQAIRNFIQFTGCTLEEVLPTVTTIPADLLGIGHERGCVEFGYIADLVLLDEDLQVQMTFAEGELLYQSVLTEAWGMAEQLII